MAKPSIDAGNPSIETLLDLIAALRGENGCPWDRKQTPSTLTVYLIEEMYELVEAIHNDDPEGVLEEIGDVLFQVLFVVYLYQQKGRFSLEQVLARIVQKMIRRHPHVFGSEKVENTADVKAQWRRIKEQEKGAQESHLDSVPAGMPSLMRAFRISERAAGTGFDWDTLDEVMAQTEDEWFEFKDEVNKSNALETNQSKATMELGDVLFSLVNVARLAGIHPETALSRSTGKFIRRFNHMETTAAGKKRSLDSFSRQEMANLWTAAKKEDPSVE
ncbi:MAG: nucleoside triphosphate pyrophosphohydrolase [Desulfobacteraceae bacterium]